QPWADAGHEIAWGQAPLVEPPARVVPATARTSDGGRRLGPGEFDECGRLVALAGIAVTGPRLDLWRAPTDNDEGYHGAGETVAQEWRRVGLHRLRHRVVSLADDGSALTVTTRVAPAATDVAFLAVYRWTSDGERLRLDLDVRQDGGWLSVLPRVGVRLAIPPDLDRVTWFGTGPGESYPDSRRAARIGRYSMGVDEWQTPYVFPQENGNRSDVRWAAFTGAGRWLRVEGDPTVHLTARRWTSEDLAAAKHTHELVAGDRIWLNVDAALQGLGSASCGPGVLPEYRLVPEPVTLRLVLSGGIGS
ncbi:MAG TPA: beta-galactosidase, partial [Pseudonocardiaceae bacterium]|nr:beta-galactosidase [Pseudonocardiaceae bacterium]